MALAFAYIPWATDFVQRGRYRRCPSPSVSPDGKYIFYMAANDIYWVSTAILEPLRAKALR